MSIITSIVAPYLDKKRSNIRDLDTKVSITKKTMSDKAKESLHNFNLPAKYIYFLYSTCIAKFE